MACRDLSHKFPGQVLFHRSTECGKSERKYWAYQQQVLEPACVFEPAHSDQVAHMIQASQKYRCPFAVKSGGHGAFAGASNIEGGITMSLERLDEIHISDDSSLVTIGMGNIWLDVYERLEARKLAVAGGRYPSVGVGGLSLGGGQSFFASSRGWTCDNIRSYQVVLADCQVIEANETSHPDLHWALRGGGNNFGVVTKITMETFPMMDGKMWGGLRIHSEDQFAQVLHAANNLGNMEADENVNGAQIINFMSVQGKKLAVAILTHSVPEPNPPVMSEYLSIPAIVDTTHIRSLTNMSRELGSSEGQLRNVTHVLKARGTATFALNEDIMTYAKDVCYDTLAELANVENADPNCVFQIITKPQLEASVIKGGNAFDLKVKDGPLFLLNIQVGWTNGGDSQRVQQAAQNALERTISYGRENGWDQEFQYMNYAGEFQDVIASYGKLAKDRLMATAEKYDPKGVFQKLQPGYFKLEGDPSGNRSVFSG
ncbi:hypothetical protein FE257_004239 [Aspergillus nanangensis]|uniref:FAD-binding PCMH-type domain-containing protein n=1 Tax=Aspergillus nanangensis TaxID=2582783 RepID=A0AAD4CS25_ASPNN|nr:hypothetical protein FE257_004239 [Aspergillus nanangensis]